MTRKVSVTTGPRAAVQAKAGIVVATLFLLFGLCFAYVVLNEETEGELKFLIGAFFLIWIVACSSIIISCVNVLKKSKNRQDDALVDLYVDDDMITPAGQRDDFESRLRKLESLKRDGLITEREYLDKRAQILQEKW